MLSQLGDIAPKTIIISGLAYAAINWGFLGPELAARKLRADGHIAQCERGFGKAVAASALKEISNIPSPEPNPQKEAAAMAMRNMMSSPLGKLMNLAGQQSGVSIEGTLSIYERQKRQAREAYERAVEAAKANTKANLGKAGDYCGCVADEAISQAQNDFAIYSGSLTLFRPAKIRDLKMLMLRAEAGSSCAHLKAGV